MKKHLQGLLIYGMFFALVLSICGIYTVSSTDKKDTYLIMTSNNEGGYDISTDVMTASEATKLRKSDNVAVVEKDGVVNGLEMNPYDEQMDFQEIEELYDNKDVHQMNAETNEFQASDIDWNMQQINADEASQQNTINTISGSAIKVCIIDSGIDYNNDTDVYMRKNFIPDQNDVSIIYEDSCGHGTSVAGIIAAKNNDDGITGINSNVLLYSAKVLDSACTAPTSRVVEAIYWAISQNVNIINISFGTTTDSIALKKAIEDAYDAGILIIAAAGNKGIVEYPAAYDEVMAIGSVNSEGQVSDFSPTSSKIELVAPGELVLSTGDFGGASVHSGTSLSSPHVAGVASVLWQKDSSVSASFIRALLDASANLYGDRNQYGYGLVDLNYALEIYDDFKNTYVEASTNSENIVENSILSNEVPIICENTNTVEVFEDNSFVEGSWGKTTHEGYVASISNPNYLIAVKAGATTPDRFIEGMTTYPQWHGYWQKKPEGSSKLYESNYIASYIYLTKMAQQWPLNYYAPSSYSDPSQLGYMTQNDFDELRNRVTIQKFWGAGGVDWQYVLTQYSTGTGVAVNNANIRYCMYGMALHSATDVFAHSTYTLDGNYISHTDDGNSSTTYDGQADTVGYLEARNNCAESMALLIVQHASSGAEGSITDFYNVLATNNNSSVTFLLKNIAEYANTVDSTYYTNHKSIFDKVNLN